MVAAAARKLASSERHITHDRGVKSLSPVGDN